MLSPDPLATDSATCATRREVRGTGLHCGAGDVPPVYHSVDEGVEPNAAERRRAEVAQRVLALERAAQAVMHSAALAEDHARRAEEAGRHDEAAKERLVAARAREAARRTRAHAARTPPS